MVKGTKIKRYGESLPNRLNSIPIFRRGVLIILFISLFISTNLFSQDTDTLSMGENRAQTLKYLKSLASVEKENCDKARFITNYEVDLTSAKEVIVNADTWIKKEPATDAENCNTLIPGNSVVKIYDSSCEPGFYAVKFRNKWGFVASDEVEQFE